MTWWKTMREVGAVAAAVRGFRAVELRSGLLPLLTPAHPYDTDVDHPGQPVFLDRLRYTFGKHVDLEAVKTFYDQHDIERELALAFAERVRLGEIRWFDRTIVCEMPPRWHHDDVVEWQRTHFSEVINHPAGDFRSVWEVARFGSVFDLVRAFVIDGDTRWPRLFENMVRSFARDNPVNEGVHWTSGQEVALRALNIFIGLACFKEQIPAGTFSEICDVLYWHGRYVHHHFEFAADVLQNNHLISESIALTTLAHHMREWPESQEWAEVGADGFERSASQFLDDGGYCQASHNYHRFAIQLLLWGGALGCDLSHFDSVFRKTEILWAAMIRRDGTLPNFGQNDGAWFGPRDVDPLRSFRATFDAVAIRNGASPDDLDRRYAAWFSDLNRPTRRAPILDASGLFSKTGLAYRTVGDHQVVLRTGVASIRSGHADLGHVDVTIAGQPIVVDSGSERYLPGRDPLMNAEHHNTVTCDSFPLREPLGQFGWHATSYEVEASVEEEVVRLRHGAFAGWQYRREVLWEDGWCVVDRLEPEVLDEVRRFVCRWKLPFEHCELRRDGGTFFVDFAHGALAVETVGMVEPIVELHESFHAPTYRHREPAMQLLIEMKTRDGFTITTRFPTSDEP